MDASVLHTLLALIALGQFVSGIFFWYCGVQVKMLRLELVSKKDCEEHREKQAADAADMGEKVAQNTADIKALAVEMKHLGGESHA